MKGACFLGIDPGLKGGLALIHPKDGVLLEPMPTIDSVLNLQALSAWLREYREDIRMAFLEQVHAMPKQGVSSMFTFGQVYGAIEAMLAAHQVPYQLVRPQEWMKSMHRGLPGGLDTKERSHLAFARLFPAVDARASAKCRVPHEGMVEATLIAEFGRRRALGVLA